MSRFWGNSSLGMQFRTCENFGDFADTKSSLNPQNFHKYKSHTANTRIVLKYYKSQNLKFKNKRGSSFRQVRGLRSHEQGNKTDCLLTKRVARLPRNCQRYNTQRLSLAF
ncbi:hypothetical protein [Helicobacter sp. 23-1045]